jgi:VWFA-related protein
MGQDAQMPRIAETLSIDIVNLDVVVTDARGNRIRNLQKEDFIVLENGKPVALTNFDEVTPPAPLPSGSVPQPGPHPNQVPRTTVFFIDESSISPAVRDRLLRAFDAFATRNFQPGDRVMIAPWNGGFRTPLRFFTEPEQIHAALQKELREPSPSILLRAAHKPSLQALAEGGCDSAISVARDYALSSRSELQRETAALRAIVGLLGAVSGKRSIIIAGEWLPQQPGREMFDALASHGCSAASLEAISGSVDIVRRLADAANAHNVALYAIDTEIVRGFSTSFLTAGPLPRGRFGLSPRPIQYDDFSVFSSRNTIDAFRNLAEATGGAAVWSTNSFGSALTRFGEDINSYYSMAFRSSASGTGQRSIEVRMKDPALKVRTRRGFTPSTFGEEFDERVIASLLSVGVRSDFDVNISVGEVTMCDNKTCTLPVTVTTSQSDKPATLAFAVRDERGNLSDVRHTECVKSPCTVALLVERGRTSIAVGAADESTQSAGFARLTIPSVSPPTLVAKDKSAWF